MKKSIAAYPDYTLAYVSLSSVESGMGHSEAALAHFRIVQQLLGRSAIPDVDPVFVNFVKKAWSFRLPLMLGDYSEVIALTTSGLEMPDQAGQREAMREGRSQALALRHETTAARATMRELPPAGLAGTTRRAVVGMRIEAASENWTNVLASESEIERMIEATAKIPGGGPQFDPANIRLVTVYPWLALAKAKLGDPVGAEGLISQTPGDCYDCVRVRGMIAAQARKWGRADFWFTKAIHDGPSLPFAFADWGQALLTRDQPDAAIAQFTLANQKGPHFADALEGWGEALMAKNQSHLALPKFAEADKYAPNWGRLHLKWGEALIYAGKADEAKDQFFRARQLDLTPTEKSELETHL